MQTANDTHPGETTLRVAALQMQIVSGEPRKNMVRAEAMLREAAHLGAQAALLPELWTCGYARDLWARIADEHARETLDFLTNEARRLNMAIIGGSFPTRKPDGIYSTCYTIRPDGEVISEYSKEHLFPLLNEPDFLRPGSSSAPAPTPAGKWASLICFDIRFPESARQLAYQGTRVLWVPAEWPHPRLEHWRTLLRARAIENQLFVVAANRCGEGDGSQWCGHSTAIDPWGNILAEAAEEECVLLANLDLTLVDEVRARIPCFNVIEDQVPV